LHKLLHASNPNPTLHTILKIANAFSSTLDDVLGRKSKQFTKIKQSKTIEESSFDLKKYINNYITRHDINPVNLAHSLGLGTDTIRDFTHFNSKKKSLSANTIVKLADHWDVSIDEMIGRTIPIKELNILKPLEIISKKTVSSKPSIVGITNISDIENIEKIKAAMTSLSNKSNIDSKSSKPVSHVAKLNASRNKKDDTPSR